MSTGMMKCLVCGAVFEAGICVCPVCGVGPDNFVPADPAKVCFRKDTEERFLILGTGTAGLSAAAAIRERNVTCSITMVSNERALPYHRPMLTKRLLDKKERDAFAIHQVTWYTQRNIRLITDEIVAAMDPAAKRATLTDGTVLSFDKCIYALGARCFIPPFPGADLPECVTIRSLDDVEKVERISAAAKNAVVIGGGVLGLEAAWELKKSGLTVTVLEGSGRLLARQLDEPASALLLEIATEKGVLVRLNAATDRIEGTAHVEGVLLKDGGAIPAEMVVISTGVRPNTQIAEAAGAEVGRAVKVNQYMETSLPGVYACGDCAEFMGVNYSIWPEATRMGQVAGMNAAGERTPYTNPTPGLTLNTMDTSLFAIGDVGGNPAKTYRTERQYDPDRKVMKTDYYVDGALTGAIRIGDNGDMEYLLNALSAE